MEKSAYKLIVPGNNELGVSFRYATDIEFAFCSPPSKDRELNLLTTFNHCRESSAGHIWAHFNPDNFDNRYKPLIAKLEFKRTRVLIRQVCPQGEKRDLSYDDIINCGVRIVNILEARYGWGLTRAFPVKLANPAGNTVPFNNVHLTYVEGNQKWVQAPQMITFYMLLLRSGLIAEIRNVKTFTDLVNAVKEFSKSRSGDKYFLRVALKFVNVFMKRHKDLFGPISENYGYNGGYDRLSVIEGVNALCQGHTTNAHMYKKFVNLAREEKIKVAKASTDYRL